MSKFLDRHRRKSVLAALLLIFRGRGKYVAVMLIVAALSVPFAVSGDMLNKFLELPPVVSLLKSVGLGSVLSSINPSYNRDLIKSAFDRAAQDADRYSLWQKLLYGLSGSSSPTGQGTVGLVQAGDDWGKIRKNSQSGIAALVSEEDKAKGQGADSVDFEDMLAMGEGGMADMAFGSGGGDAGPFMDRKVLSSKNRIAGKNEGVYNSAMSSANIPEPRDPKTGKIKTKKLGRASGFSWKNVGYKSKGAAMDVRINTNRRAMFQASETFAMTVSAYKGNSAKEHQASYVGSTYDGNDVNADIITTDGAPALPDTGYTGDLLNSANNWMEMAEKCAKANETEGAKISEYEKEISKLAPKLADRPKCCKGSAVDRYNNDVVEKMRDYCKKINAASTALGAACQNANPQQHNCSEYDSMRVKKCSKLKCWLGIILGVIMIIIGVIIGILASWTGVGLVIGVALIAAGAALVIGQIFGGTIGLIASIVAGVAAMVFGGPLAALAMGALSWVAGKAMDKWGTEDGSSVGDEWGTRSE